MWKEMLKSDKMSAKEKAKIINRIAAQMSRNRNKEDVKSIKEQFESLKAKYEALAKILDEELVLSVKKMFLYSYLRIRSRDKNSIAKTVKQILFLSS